MKAAPTAIVAWFCMAAMGLAEPVPPADVVFRPMFMGDKDCFGSGTGFVAKFNGQPYFFTAYHLFGLASGLSRDLSPSEARDFSMAGVAIGNRNVMISAPEMLFVPTAKPADWTDAGHDFAVYPMPNYSGASLTISGAAPLKGDRVYVYARPRGEEGVKVLAARVSRIDGGVMEFVYDDSGWNLSGTSGAPVLNEKGEVVALNVGGAQVKGQLVGLAAPMGQIISLMSDALAKASD